MASNIVDGKKMYISIKNWLEEFFEALITNLLLKFENFENPNWRMQYGRRNVFFHIPTKEWIMGFSQQCKKKRFSILVCGIYFNFLFLIWINAKTICHREKLCRLNLINLLHSTQNYRDRNVIMKHPVYVYQMFFKELVSYSIS